MSFLAILSAIGLKSRPIVEGFITHYTKQDVTKIVSLCKYGLKYDGVLINLSALRAAKTLWPKLHRVLAILSAVGLIVLDTKTVSNAL